MASDYAALQADVATWLHRDDLSANIPTFISGALARVNLELAGFAGGGLVDQEQEAYQALANGEDSLPMPDDFRALRYLKIGDRTLTASDYNVLIDTFGDMQGPPQEYAVMAGGWTFRPIADASYTISIGYLKRYPEFVNGTDTNYLLTDCGNLLLYAACMEAAPFLIDDARLVTWQSMYRDAMRRLEAADQEARRTPKGRVVRMPLSLLYGKRTYDINTDQ